MILASFGNDTGFKCPISIPGNINCDISVTAVYLLGIRAVPAVTGTVSNASLIWFIT